MVVIVPRTFPALGHSADFAGETIYAFRANCSYRRHFESWFAHEGVTPGRIVEMESYHSILACVIAGAGIALIPRSTLETMPGSSSVKVFELGAPFRNVNTWLFWRKEGHHPNVTALLSLINATAPLERAAAPKLPVAENSPNRLLL